MDQPNAHQCITCRQQAGTDELFLRWRNGYLCPQCYMRSQRRHQTGVFLRDVVLFILGFNLVPLTLFRGGWSIAWPNLLLLVGVIYLAISLHELAHAAAAWLTGGKVFEVCNGSGRTLAQWRVGSLVLTLGRLPGVGFCAAAFPTRERIRARMALLLLAGMAANLLSILLVLPGFDAHRLEAPMALRETIVLGSLVALLASLWPALGAIGGVPQESDGLGLIRLLRGKRSPELLHLAYYALEGAYAMRRHDFAAAINWCRQGLVEYPDSELLQNNLAVALIEEERYREALPILEGLAYSDHPHALAEYGSSLAQQGFHHALLLNNTAAVTVLVNTDAPALRKASVLAKLAVQMFPTQPSFRGTLGAVLVEQGEFETGIKHLTWACRHALDPRSQAYCLAYTAIAHYRQADYQKANNFLAQAVAREASSYAVRKAQSVLLAA